MAPPKPDSYRTSYVEGAGRSSKCKICSKVCNGRRIVEKKYMDDDLLKTYNFSEFCKKCETEVCSDCFKNKLCCQKNLKPSKTVETSTSFLEKNGFCILFGVVVCATVSLFFFKNFTTGENYKDSKQAIIKDEFYNLKNKFPDQKPELWQNVLHVMNNSDTVTALTFLYKEDSSTSDCLAEEIAYSYSRIQNRTFDLESIFTADNQVKDFGSVLEEYGLKVAKTNLLIIKHLQEISGNVARVFHTLCDKITPRVRPSVYIFTLRYDDTVENVEKPIPKASSTLRKAWKDLPEKELHALITRIVTNVVEVKSVKPKRS